MHLKMSFFKIPFNLSRVFHIINTIASYELATQASSIQHIIPHDIDSTKRVNNICIGLYMITEFPMTIMVIIDEGNLPVQLNIS